VGDNLTENSYSWHRLSNLLFFESPAGVGYSINTDSNYTHNDATTAHDSLYAVIDFFEKFPEYKGRPFFIAGESYAGKYIPDLAVLIDTYNYVGEGNRINIKSIIIGNGVIDHRTITYNTYEYMIERRFVDPEVVPIFKSSCQTDPYSAGCSFFETEFRKGTVELNPYSS
jgi:serine carboxypeptidase-like clade II